MKDSGEGLRGVKGSKEELNDLLAKSASTVTPQQVDTQFRTDGLVIACASIFADKASFCRRRIVI
jgi:hypothetical protein